MIPAHETLSTEEYWIAHGNAKRMETTGGGFHSTLGKLFYKADMQNATRLVRAFPHEFLKELTHESRTN